MSVHVSKRTSGGSMHKRAFDQGDLLASPPVALCILPTRRFCHGTRHIALRRSRFPPRSGCLRRSSTDSPKRFSTRRSISRVMVPSLYVEKSLSVTQWSPYVPARGPEKDLTYEYQRAGEGFHRHVHEGRTRGRWEEILVRRHREPRADDRRYGGAQGAQGGRRKKPMVEREPRSA